MTFSTRFSPDDFICQVGAATNSSPVILDKNVQLQTSIKLYKNIAISKLFNKILIFKIINIQQPFSHTSFSVNKKRITKLYSHDQLCFISNDSSFISWLKI